MPAPVVVFDLDGVIADSLSYLYQVYERMLARFGVRGNQQEFDRLNGPSLPEICDYLVAHHQLQISPDALLKSYRTALSHSAHEVPVMPGAVGVLQTLHFFGIEMRLASASPREHVDTILKRFSLTDYFSRIVSGDDVKQAKPNPEIYLAATEGCDVNDCIAIEDSRHGLDSAKAAGLATLYFTPSKTPLRPHCFRTARHQQISCLGDIIHALDARPIPVDINTAGVKNLVIEHASHSPPILDDTTLASEVNYAWQQAKHRNKQLFDAPVACYASHTEKQGALDLKLCELPYRYVWYLSTHSDKACHSDARPIGVSAILRCDGPNSTHTLVAKRSASVTQYPEHWECAPSGTFNDLQNSPETLISAELLEETGISKEQIVHIRFLALSFDRATQTFDLNYEILLKAFPSLAQLEQNSEYTDWKWIPLSELSNGGEALKAIVPNSIRLAQLTTQNLPT